MNLHRECDELMSTRQSGTYGTREWRSKIIHNFIDTLLDLNIAPNKLAEVNDCHIAAAVEHWREQKLSLKTIGNSLSALRNFFKKSKLDILIPSNESLGVIYCNAHKKEVIEMAINPDMLDH